MFVTRIKSMLAGVLVVGMALAGAAGLLYRTQAAERLQDSNKVVQAPKPAEKEAPAPASLDEKTAPKNAKQEQKVLTPEEAIKRMPKENVTVQFKVASVEVTGWYFGYPAAYYIILKDGGKFAARLIVGGIGDQNPLKKLGFEKVEDFKGKMVRVTGRVEPAGNESFRMFVRDSDIEVVKE